MRSQLYFEPCFEALQLHCLQTVQLNRLTFCEWGCESTTEKLEISDYDKAEIRVMFIYQTILYYLDSDEFIAMLILE